MALVSLLMPSLHPSSVCQGCCAQGWGARTPHAHVHPWHPRQAGCKCHLEASGTQPGHSAFSSRLIPDGLFACLTIWMSTCILNKTFSQTEILIRECKQTNKNYSSLSFTNSGNGASNTQWLTSTPVIVLDSAAPHHTVPILHQILLSLPKPTLEAIHFPPCLQLVFFG